jgi:hypothetical protein
MLRPTGSGPLSALLVLAPLVALPILAVVGIPQFAPGNLIDSQHPSTNSTSRKGSGTPESRLGEAAHSDADDLFAPLGKATNGFEDPLRRSSKKKTRSRSTRNDDNAEEGEFGNDRNGFDSATQSRSRSRGKASALVNVDDEETDSSSEPEFESSSSTTGNRGSRSRLRSQSRDDDSEDRKSDDSDVSLSDDDENPPKGEQFADASDEISNSSRPTKSRGAPSRRAPQSSDATDAELFEGTQEETRTPSKPKGGSRPPVGRGRQSDPNDAPIFDPNAGEQNAGRRADATEQEDPSARKPSSRNLTKTGASTDAADSNEAAGSTRGATVTNPAANVAQEKNLKDLFNSLKAGGMLAEDCVFIYLEDTESFVFRCYASRGGNSTPQKFEAEASEPILAVAKVLKQVQTWRQQKSSKKTRSSQE